MTQINRQSAITAAETSIGVTFPKELKELLAEFGQASFKTSFEIGADCTIRLCQNPKGARLFADAWGNGLVLDFWGEFEDTETLSHSDAKRSVLVLNNGQGDSVFLSPDNAGSARRLMFFDHETGKVTETAADIVSVLAPPPLEAYARQALSISPCAEDEQPVVRIGGMPMLEPDVPWPLGRTDKRPLHYYGAIDFAALHSRLSDKERLTTPQLPLSGSLQIFLNMYAKADDQLEVKVLHSASSVDETSHRELPADLASMRDGSQFVDAVSLSECGRMFLRSDHVLNVQSGTVRPSRPERNKFDKVSLHDLAQERLNQPMTHRAAFGIAQELVAICFSLVESELVAWERQGVKAKDISYFRKRLAKERDKFERISLGGKPNLWDRFVLESGRLPKSESDFDTVFIDWMRYAQVLHTSKDSGSMLSEEERTWFQTAFNRIAVLANDRNALNLLNLLDMQNHDVTGDDLYRCARKMMIKGAYDMALVQATSGFDTQQIAPFKMLGASDAMDKPEYDDTKHTLLFQIANTPGLRFLDIGTLLSVWIKPPDLIENRYDRIVCAFDSVD
ncbi:DUF1963 domain-containing protein [Thalassococcus lentus]|uniref:DUF1963 domain-containing protein n=1 Tax=Thalassococcus lentus TaxID=1210524 RepID=A0ABT4XR23_9RHOB|nr:DUF1963 domain-containing protein [Thalassococcus lentus]MDA7424403.1 DUF1963 domain-containing protein [Thalassococcus lentus]